MQISIFVFRHHSMMSDYFSLKVTRFQLSATVFLELKQTSYAKINTKTHMFLQSEESLRQKLLDFCVYRNLISKFAHSEASIP